ncbi:MAG: enoyl-CoA hydratase-related protein [Phycisphaerales bacterium]
MDAALRYERDSDGVVTLCIDQPDKSVVVLDSALLDQITAALDAIERDGEPSGLILTSGSDRVFIAGADLKEIGGLDDAGLDAYLARGQNLFNRLEQFSFPTVACINGAALGGGLEIALACRYRVAADASRGYEIGLPEARLGILPGWGGTQRLAAVIDPGVALGRTMTGRPFSHRAAARLGLVDALAPADRLREFALKLVLDDPKSNRPRTIQDRGEEVLGALERIAVIDTRPVRRLPAARRVLDAVRIGLAEGLDAGLEAERRFLIELRSTAESRGMLSGFFARGGTARSELKKIGVEPSATDRVGVFGEGPIADQIAERLGRRHTVERLGFETTSSDAEFFIEAAGDSRQEQLAALRAISAFASDDAVIATTSPVLGIDEIAESVTNPSRLVGVAPARPVANPACEIIAGRTTSDETVAAALIIAQSLGRVPIVQRVGGPSLLTRLFGQIVLAALEEARRTGDPARVDRAARAEGLSVGPLRSLDAVGVRNAAFMVGRGDQLVGVTRIYEDDGSISDEFARWLGAAQEGADDEPARADFVTRALVDAGSRAIEDGIIESTETLWLAAVFGLGLGAWRRDWLEEVRNQVTVSGGVEAGR